jgi:hypothetical protein
MTVGNQGNSGQVDSLISNLSVNIRNLMQSAVNLSTWVNGQGDGQTFLESLGYDSGDATTALAAIAYLSTVAGCYYGTVQQGGTGGTGATTFNFNQELSQYWGGQ